MNRLSAPRYDLFKLLVTVVLVIILILMLVRGCATVPAATLPTQNGSVTDPAQGSLSTVPSETFIVTGAVATSTPLPAPSATSAAAGTTPTSAPPSESTPTATEDATPVDASATTVISGDTSCNTRMPSRLRIGQRARVAQRLNMRVAPSIDAPILQTNAVQTTVDIIGGPVCTPMGERAYLWWQIRLTDGAEGWSAESQLNEPAYLLQPVP